MAQSLRLRPIMFRTLGIILCVVGYAILLLPGPLGWPGIPPLVLGALLILRSSPGAKRSFVQAARQQPATFGRLRRWIAEQRSKRWRKPQQQRRAS
jgi:hypothetical protein